MNTRVRLLPLKPAPVRAEVTLGGWDGGVPAAVSVSVEGAVDKLPDAVGANPAELGEATVALAWIGGIPAHS